MRPFAGLHRDHAHGLQYAPNQDRDVNLHDPNAAAPTRLDPAGNALFGPGREASEVRRDQHRGTIYRQAKWPAQVHGQRKLIRVLQVCIRRLFAKVKWRCLVRSLRQISLDHRDIRNHNRGCLLFGDDFLAARRRHHVLGQPPPTQPGQQYEDRSNYAHRNERSVGQLWHSLLVANRHSDVRKVLPYSSGLYNMFMPTTAPLPREHRPLRIRVTAGGHAHA